MSIEIKVPEAGESVQEVHIGRWLKDEGDTVAEDEDVVELDTDKASMEIPSPAAGVLREIRKREGDMAQVGEVIAILEEGDGKAPQKAEAEEAEEAETEAKQKRGNGKPKKKAKKEKKKSQKHVEEGKEEKRRQERKEPEKKAAAEEEGEPDQADAAEETAEAPHATPAARRELRKYGLSAKDIKPEGNRIRPEDVRRHVEQQRAEKPAPKEKEPRRDEDTTERPQREAESELEEVVPMSYLRKRIAQRLVEAQQKAALLTTFNEIDMSHVVEARQALGERFRQEYGVKLGFMSFFVKAVIDALKHQPELNAEIRDDENIVYRNYYHIGIAIGSGKGLVVPVLRHAERLSFAEIEQAIDDFARRAESGDLTPDELQGGTFTITNGGVYGSLLSTPIINPPQSGVLGMHAIEDRPVARDGKVVIRPMMYVALTYDHRIVDGREAVSFLRRVKEAVEDPARMLIEV